MNLPVCIVSPLPSPIRQWCGYTIGLSANTDPFRIQPSVKAFVGHGTVNPTTAEKDIIAAPLDSTIGFTGKIYCDTFFRQVLFQLLPVEPLNAPSTVSWIRYLTAFSPEPMTVHLLFILAEGSILFSYKVAYLSEQPPVFVGDVLRSWIWAKCASWFSLFAIPASARRACTTSCGTASLT